MQSPHIRPLRRAWTAATVGIAGLIGALCGALLAAQQRWGAGEPICTSGPPPFPTPVCEVPFEASGWALVVAAAASGLLLAGLALLGSRAVERVSRQVSGAANGATDAPSRNAGPGADVPPE